MKELTVRFKDTEELLTYFDRLKELISEGYQSGTLSELYWDINTVDEL